MAFHALLSQQQALALYEDGEDDSSTDSSGSGTASAVLRRFLNLTARAMAP